ncbi:Eukaryotic translation initiation factor 3 subunit A [Saitozyma sp. JCM 24511]|nr:Eukaryotic translation initiation factor 3 subunit A [Saitozyma sp. JCM 24511]
MPPIYVKPENALKRSEELLALGTPQSQQQAFENLVEVFQSKRFKHTPVPVLEPIMNKFIDLCVSMSRKSHIRAGLLNYRNAVQSTSIQSIENALNHFIAKAEERLAVATEQAKQEVAALPETPVVDDELPLQPASLLLDTFVDSAGDRERIERRLIAPAQKFCWDAYDICLDVAKGNDRLEVVYQSIAHRAFNFCKVHQRKTDFRRLCEQRLRKDLANAAKYAHQQHAVNLADPETLSRHLDTRFLQLETAVELELWQEAFRSVEDVHGLVAGKKSAKPSMMANYYEKLTQIFKAEGGKQTAVFHAAAWARYFQYAERAGSVPEKASGCVLLSALAVPLGDVESKQRLVALLNLPKMPTRDALVKDAAAKHLRRVPQEIRQLYNILEVDFQPLKASKLLAPVISSLPTEYQSYLPALRDVVLSRLLQELSQVYDTVTLSHVLDLVKPFDGTAWATDMPALEKFLMTAARRGDINASVDHVAQSISFVTKTTDVNRLSNLAVCLYNTIQYLNPAPTTTRAEAFAQAIAQAEEERKAVAQRRQIVTKRRELLEEANARREREETTAKAERQKQIAEENARREKELARQGEIDRLQKQMEATRREEARKLAESLAATGALKIDMSKVEDLDSNEVLALQVQQLDKEKRELNDRLRIVGKRVDHLERAMRKEERPLLADDYERQKQTDKISHEQANKVAREIAIAQNQAAKELKERLARMLPDYLEARKEVESQREVEFQQAREAAQRKIEEEKAKFRASVIARRKADRERREQERLREEEEERLAKERAEAEAAAAAQEEQREAEARAEIEKRNAEAAERAAKQRAERDAERAAAAEAARKQREREEEAERRRAERASGGGAYRRPEPAAAAAASTSPAPIAPTSVKAGGWRDRLAAKQAAGGEPSPASPVGPSPTGSPAPAPAPANGTTSPAPAQGEAAPERGVFRAGRGSWSARGRGGASTPPTSTRGGAAGGSRW